MKRPWFPFYGGDYLSDTSELSLAEHGCYVLLMIHYYQSGPLPQDRRILRRICRCNTTRERAVLESILSRFFTLTESVFRHKRIDVERTKIAEISRHRSNAAKMRHDANAMQMHTTTHNSQPQLQLEPQPQPHKELARKRAKSPIPINFCISERVQQWATTHGHTRLQERLEHFVGYAKANGKCYADWEQAFMNAVRDDWAHLNGTGASNLNKAEQRKLSNLEVNERVKQRLREKYAAASRVD